MTNIEKIIEACIKANLEIIELKFGCIVKPKDYKQWKWVEKKDTAYILYSYKELGEFKLGWSDSRISTEKVADFEILGRPIRLADVLSVVQVKVKNNETVMVPSVAGDKGSPIRNMLEWLYNNWNLLDDDLNHQSLETQEFIASLL